MAGCCPLFLQELKGESGIDLYEVPCLSSCLDRPMSEIKLTDLDTRLQKQVASASKAVESGDAGYAIDICSGVLARHPECLEVRRMLRIAEFRAHGARKNGLRNILSFFTHITFILGAGRMLKEDPMLVLERSEKILRGNPTYATAHRLLAQAAQALRLHETAAFAYETIKSCEPDNISNLIDLGEAYIVAGHPRKAVEIGDLVLTMNPLNSEATALINKGSVDHSIKEGGWDDQKTDYRTKLKDEDASIEREQISRVATDEATVKALIDSTLRKIESEPDNFNHFRDLSQYYRKIGDFDRAIEWLAKTRNLPQGQSDSALEHTEMDWVIQRFKHDLKPLRQAADSEPDNPEFKNRAQAKAQELHHYEREQAQALVEKYPNDHGYRMQWGELLFSDGDMEGASHQFQLAKRNPKLRVRSLMFLGKAFESGGKYDLALEQFIAASSEISAMTELKKEIVYELALCYERLGQEQKAFGEYKAIYTADVSYRDVAEKINKHYENK